MDTDALLTLPSDYPWDQSGGVDVFLNLDEVVESGFAGSDILTTPTSPLFGFESSDDSGLSPPHSTEHSSSQSSPLHPGYSSFPSSPLREDVFVNSTYSSYFSLPDLMEHNDLRPALPEIKEEPSMKANKNKPRKRQRKDEKVEPMQHEVTAVTLSKDTLLKISSAELEAFFRKFTSVRSLTDAEEREVKRQRRLVKNRESALASRERKKSLMHDYEAANKQLTQDNQVLHEQNSQLRTENDSLRAENNQLRQILDGQGKSHLLGQLGQLATISRPRTAPGVSTEKVRNAGAVLLIVMLSFGLVITNNSPFKKAPTSEVVSRDSVAAASALVKRGVDQPILTRSPVQRVLLEVAAERVDQRNDSVQSKLPPSAVEPLALPLSASEPLVEIKLEPMDIDAPSKSTPRIEPTRIERSGTRSPSSSKAPTPIKMRVQDEPDDDDDDEAMRRWQSQTSASKSTQPPSTFMSGFMNSSTPVISTDQDADLNSWSHNRTRTSRPNTAYVTCPSGLRQVIPADTDPLDPDAPFYISMLIPTRSTLGSKSKAKFLSNSSSMDQDQDQDTEDGPEGMLEITCQVVDIQMIPFKNVPALVA
eukprot:TRINITY_DN9974_c0_g1_i1.p1 TRINITY_DN9974_c0_g1~~TRINITY_DN9974_c0_g1_i1.p1  ORF type:complete len:591 (+),score=174.93 TRINITY_DN9974_c0_g1_i1:154-1926(+)